MQNHLIAVRAVISSGDTPDDMATESGDGGIDIFENNRKIKYENE